MHDLLAISFKADTSSIAFTTDDPPSCSYTLHCRCSPDWVARRDLALAWAGLGSSGSGYWVGRLQRPRLHCSECWESPVAAAAGQCG